jgi:hypothetical protein
MDSIVEKGNIVGPLASLAQQSLPGAFPIMDNYERAINDLVNEPRDPRFSWRCRNRDTRNE